MAGKRKIKERWETKRGRLKEVPCPVVWDAPHEPWIKARPSTSVEPSNFVFCLPNRRTGSGLEEAAIRPHPAASPRPPTTRGEFSRRTRRLRHPVVAISRGSGVHASLPERMPPTPARPHNTNRAERLHDNGALHLPQIAVSSASPSPPRALAFACTPFGLRIIYVRITKTIDSVNTR